MFYLVESTELAYLEDEKQCVREVFPRRFCSRTFVASKNNRELSHPCSRVRMLGIQNQIFILQNRF
jgi:hypothetical protein